MLVQRLVGRASVQADTAQAQLRVPFKHAVGAGSHVYVGGCDDGPPSGWTAPPTIWTLTHTWLEVQAGVQPVLASGPPPPASAMQMPEHAPDGVTPPGHVQLEPEQVAGVPTSHPIALKLQHSGVGPAQPGWIQLVPLQPGAAAVPHIQAPLVHWAWPSGSWPQQVESSLPKQFGA